MARAAPHRGALEVRGGDSFAIGIQSTVKSASIAEDERWLVALHGHVGNRAELAAEFTVGESEESDARWLLRYFDLRGMNTALSSLRGGFALIARDKVSGTVLAARDATGLCPLFFVRTAKSLVLGSEIRQIAQGADLRLIPDTGFLVDFIAFQLRPTEHTAMRGMSRLVPGEVYTWKGPCFVPHERKSYWSPPATCAAATTTVEATVADLRSRLERAVARTCQRHVFGVGLSGGLDSSSVWALACSDRGLRQRARAYSIVFPGADDDESAYMRAQVEHSGLDAWTRIDGLERSPLSDCGEIAAAVDSPWVRSLQQILLMGEALRADGRRVFLTGLGGDEWLDGSIRYLEDELASGHYLRAASDCFRIRAPHLPDSAWWRLRYLRGNWVRSRRWADAPSSRMRPDWLASGPWTRQVEEAQALAEEVWREPSHARADLLLRLMWHRGGHPMEPLEQLAAAVGLELRHPLMDLDIVEFAFRTPAREFYSGARPRHLLRLALDRDLAPEVRDRLDKGRYRVHEAEDLARVLDNWRASSLWRLVEIGIVDPNGLRRLVARAEQGDRSAALTLLDLFPVEVWLRRRFT